MYFSYAKSEQETQQLQLRRRELVGLILESMYLIDLSYRKNTIFENHFGKEGFYGEKKKLLKKDFQENILFLSFVILENEDFYEMDLLGFFSRKTKI